MAEFVDVATPVGGRSGGSDSHFRGARTHVTETVQLGSLDATPTAKSGAERETITISPRATVAGRSLSDRAKEMLANIDDHDTVDAVADSPPAAAARAEVAPPPAAPAVPPPTPAAAAAPASAPVEPAKPVADDVTAARDRALEHNARLLAELDTLKKRPTRGEPSAREKALDEIAHMYIENPVAANRKLAALVLGIDDPAHKDVDRNIRWLYQDLNEGELKVPLETSEKALRESERNRLLMDLDRRDREAAAKPVAPTEQPEGPDAQRTAAHTEIVASRLAAKVGTEPSIAERHPMLMTLSQDFSGMKPEALVLADIYRGFQTGEYDPKADNEKLIDQATKKIEAQYQALADKILKARSSTAAATQAPAAKDEKASPTGNGTRTITAASASVAPATLPTVTKPVTPEAPKYRNEAERRKAIAQKHFPDAT